MSEPRKNKVVLWSRLPDRVQRCILGKLDLRPENKLRVRRWTKDPDGRRVMHMWTQREAVLSVSRAFARAAFLSRADLIQDALDAHVAAFQAWAKRLVAGDAAPFVAPPVADALQRWVRVDDDCSVPQYRPWVLYSWFVEVRDPSGGQRFLNAQGQPYTAVDFHRQPEAAKHSGCQGTGVRYKWAVVQHAVAGCARAWEDKVAALRLSAERCNVEQD